MYSSCNLFREFGKGKQVDQWLKLFIRYNLSEQKYIRSINFFFSFSKNIINHFLYYWDFIQQKFPNFILVKLVHWDRHWNGTLWLSLVKTLFTLNKVSCLIKFNLVFPKPFDRRGFFLIKNLLALR